MCLFTFAMSIYHAINFTTKRWADAIRSGKMRRDNAILFSKAVRHCIYC